MKNLRTGDKMTEEKELKLTSFHEHTKIITVAAIDKKTGRYSTSKDKGRTARL